MKNSNLLKQIIKEEIIKVLAEGEVNKDMTLKSFVKAHGLGKFTFKVKDKNNQGERVNDDRTLTITQKMADEEGNKTLKNFLEVMNVYSFSKK
jgi:hypothetical protein